MILFIVTITVTPDGMFSPNFNLVRKHHSRGYYISHGIVQVTPRTLFCYQITDLDKIYVRGDIHYHPFS